MIQERALPKFDTASVQISKETGLLLYEDMVLGRFFEDKCAEMYYRGKMFGFVHLYNGQEAVSSGVIKAMRPGEDFVSSTYRDHVHALSAGVPAKKSWQNYSVKPQVVVKAVVARCTCFLPNIVC